MIHSGIAYDSDESLYSQHQTQMELMKSLIFYVAVLMAIFVLFAALPVEAATYYIDYENGNDLNDGATKNTPWKRCPGMKGFAGNYLHTPGDNFIFKGGVIWPAVTLPFRIGNSGIAKDIDTYSSDESWFKGDIWTRPVLNGEGTLTSIYQMVYFFKKQYIRFSKFKIANAGVSGGETGGRPVMLYNSDNIEIDNCRFVPYAHHSIVGAINAGDLKNIAIHDNEFSDASNFIEFGVSGGSLDGLEIFNNRFHDPWTMTVAGDHADGIHCFGKYEEYPFTKLKIYNNYFYGNYGSRDGTSASTAMIYLSGAALISPLVYNNVLTYKIEKSLRDGAVFRTLMLFLKNKNPKVLNNTLKGRKGYTDMSAGIDIFESSDIVCQNNLVADTPHPIRIGGGSTVSVVNNNLLWPAEGSRVGIYEGDFCSWEEWQAYGFDLAGIKEDPKFINNTYPYNLGLEESSPARGRGVNLSTKFKEDFLGIPRPVTGAWDIGAYQYRGNFFLKAPVLKIASPK